MTTNWRQLAATAGLTIEAIKETLPITWVVSVACGIPLDQTGSDRLVGQCPFHVDSDPSLDVYDGGDRWGCFPCGLNGDVFDWIGRYYELESFADRFAKAQQLHNTFTLEAESWESPVTATSVVPTDPAVLYKEWEWANGPGWDTRGYILPEFLKAKGLFERGVDASWLHAAFLVGADDQGIFAPHLDIEHNIIGYKSRHGVGTHWYARKGGNLTSLYGEWRITGKQELVITEGETDTWLMASLLEGTADVVGLPSGAGAHIRDEWVTLCKNKIVTLLFDSDQAGRNAARRWHAALNEVTTETHIGWADENSDLGDSVNPMLAYTKAEPVVHSAGLVVTRADGLAYESVPARGQPIPITNWILNPTRLILFNNDSGSFSSEHLGFEGYLTGDSRRRVVIQQTDLSTQGRIVSWAMEQGREWQGRSNGHVQGLWGLLIEQARFLPQGYASNVAGFKPEYNVFVLPEESGGTIGADDGQWRYIPPTTGSASMDRFNIVDGPWEPELINLMLGLYSTDIITPIIAWFVAAYFRSICEVFPPLAVLGGSGTGKTTLVVALWRVFTGVRGTDAELNLSGTTPHAVRVWGASNTGIALFFDEYRRGARKDTLLAVEQLLRDAWTGSESTRGGYGEKLADIVGWRSMSPLIIGGESAFEEQSHIERIIQLPLNNSKKGNTLGKLQRAVKTGFARDIVKWMMDAYERGEITAPDLNSTVVQRRKEQLFPAVDQSDREHQGEMVLEWGWDIFTRFAKQRTGVDVGPLDLSLVRSVRAEAETSPIVTALREAIENDLIDPNDKLPLAWLDDDGHIYVRMHQWYRWSEFNGYILPGNETAVTSWIRETWGVEKTRIWWNPTGAMGAFMEATRLRVHKLDTSATEHVLEED